MGCRRRAQLRWPLANPGGAAIRAKCWLIVIGECEPKVGAMGNGEICAERGGALTGMCGVMGRGRFLGVVFFCRSNTQIKKTWHAVATRHSRGVINLPIAWSEECLLHASVV